MYILCVLFLSLDFKYQINRIKRKRDLLTTPKNIFVDMTGDHTSVIYGTHYPNRLFVGCLPSNAKAEELGTFFSQFGNVVEAKIVLDPKGNSKKFGFVTFSKPDYVDVVIKKEEVYFKGKKINVGPAVKKNMEPNSVQNKTPTKQQQAPIKPPVTMPGNHTQYPKTIIRKSPTENIESNFNFNADHTFCSLWGISNTSNSVWAPQRTNEMPDMPMEKPFSLLNQLRGGESSEHGSLQSGYSYSNAVSAPTDAYFGFNNR